MNETIDCFISNSIRLAYQALVYKGKGNFDSLTAKQCYGCNRIFAGKKILEKHIKVCGSLPGIIYKFENQNISSFEDNFRFMGQLPFAVYFDLETPCRKKVFENMESSDRKMYPVSYCFVNAYHPSLKLNSVSVVRSFSHSFEELNDISYLNQEMIKFFDLITARQLPD